MEFWKLRGKFHIHHKRNTTKHVKHWVLVQFIFRHLAIEWNVFMRLCCDDAITKSDGSIFTQFKAEFTPRTNSATAGVYLIWKPPMTRRTLQFDELWCGNSGFNSDLAQRWCVYIWPFLFLAYHILIMILKT